MAKMTDNNTPSDERKQNDANDATRNEGLGGLIEQARQLIIGDRAAKESRNRDLDEELNGASRERGYHRPRGY